MSAAPPDSGPRVLVAGATGSVGREVCARLKQAGCFVRVLVRDSGRAATLGADEILLVKSVDEATLRGCADGIEVVVSCLGAPVTLDLGARPSFFDVDTRANEALIAESQRAGVRRFVYVACHVEPGFAQTRYVRAHEAVVARLAASGLSYTVVRPTGIFSAFADLVPMARRGLLPQIGDGKTETNPIHPGDVAQAIVGAISDGPHELSVGGPEIMTRQQTLEQVFAALGKRARILRVPPGLFRAMGVLIGALHPRLGELLEFFAAVSTSRSVAPSVGTQRLSDYYRQLALPPPAIRQAP